MVLTPGLEFELVLACISIDRAKDERIHEILGHDLDWQILLQIVKNQEVFPILYHRLKEVGEKYIPPEAMSHWKALFQVNAQRNLLLTRKLIRVAYLFTEQKIN